MSKFVFTLISIHFVSCIAPSRPAGHLFSARVRCHLTGNKTCPNTSCAALKFSHTFTAFVLLTRASVCWRGSVECSELSLKTLNKLIRELVDDQRFVKRTGCRWCISTAVILQLYFFYFGWYLLIFIEKPFLTERLFNEYQVQVNNRAHTRGINVDMNPRWTAWFLFYWISTQIEAFKADKDVWKGWSGVRCPGRHSYGSFSWETWAAKRPFAPLLAVRFRALLKKWVEDCELGDSHTLIHTAHSNANDAVGLSPFGLIILSALFEFIELGVWSSWFQNTDTY